MVGQVKIKVNSMLIIFFDMAPCDSSLFLQLKIKLKGCHFYTTVVIEAESQAVLNTLIEHDFQDAFKKWQKRLEVCMCKERD
jgi:hypothetical protein